MNLKKLFREYFYCNLSSDDLYESLSKSIVGRNEFLCVNCIKVYSYNNGGYLACEECAHDMCRECIKFENICGDDLKEYFNKKHCKLCNDKINSIILEP